MIDVVCGVIRGPESRILACKRPVAKHLGGLWEFPGGKVEPGEKPDDALIRELREELGIEVAVESALTPVEWAYDTVAIRLLPFFCRILSGVPQAIEHEEILWCDVTKINYMQWAPADLPVLKEIAGFKRV